MYGEALVQQLFEITVKGKKEGKKVAGCKVGNGVFQRARKARVIRNGEALHTGEWFSPSLRVRIADPSSLLVPRPPFHFLAHLVSHLLAIAELSPLALAVHLPPTGTVSTLKQVKKDVLEIPKGVECGIALDDWDAFEPDDLIQSIEEIEVVRTL